MGRLILLIVEIAGKQLVGGFKNHLKTSLVRIIGHFWVTSVPMELNGKKKNRERGGRIDSIKFLTLDIILLFR